MKNGLVLQSVGNYDDRPGRTEIAAESPRERLMADRIAIFIRRTLRAASMATCLAAVLACSHAMVGHLSARAAAGESSGTPVEELRHETSIARREAKLLIHFSAPLPAFDLPLTSGRQESLAAAQRSTIRAPLSGGQHALRNGLGAPLLT
jgi:hypothetical protein